MLGRRTFLTALALAGCSERRRPEALAAAAAAPASASPPAPPEPSHAEGEAEREGGLGPRGEIRLDTWSLEGGGRAVVLTPAWAEPGARLPVLFALHGRGEALKGPEAGVMGWPRDYALTRALARVCAPPLTSADLEGFVDRARLAEHNAALRREPFRGLVVVCPYSPDVDLRKPEQIREYADYVMRALVPRVKRELPVLDAPRSWGIDGVSLGGALALHIGLGHAEAFGALGSLQAAVGRDQVPDFTALVRRARAANPSLALRLLTSDEDYFRGALRALSGALRREGLTHEFVEIPGPHDYPFNRGPGAIEMLLWHERTLART